MKPQIQQFKSAPTAAGAKICLKKMNTWAFNHTSWLQLDLLQEDGLMHDILLLGGVQLQNNDGEVLVLACSPPVLGCVQPEFAGGDTYKKSPTSWHPLG
jgi:hypothetical protein